MRNARLLFSLTILACLSLVACGGASQNPPSGTANATDAGAQATDAYFERTSFDLPGDGVDNANGYIGPFCCTGKTVTIRPSGGGRDLGYVYFYGFGPAYNVSDTDSVAESAQILVSAVRNLDDPSSAQEMSEIDFAATEMTPGAAKSVRIGALTYTVTIATADLTTDRGTTFFDMGTFAVKVDVAR